MRIQFEGKKCSLRIGSDGRRYLEFEAASQKGHPNLEGRFPEMAPTDVLNWNKHPLILRLVAAPTSEAIRTVREIAQLKGEQFVEPQVETNGLAEVDGDTLVLSSFVEDSQFDEHLRGLQLSQIDGSENRYSGQVQFTVLRNGVALESLDTNLLAIFLSQQTFLVAIFSRQIRFCV
jgi:hypothetical protein